MKHKFINSVLLALIVSVSLIACSSDDDSTSNEIIKSQIEANVKNGTFHITKFIDSGDDETNHFSGYNFTFGMNNVLTASNGTNSYTGTWSITDSNGDNDSQNQLDFNILFISPPDFAELSEDWSFISQTSSKIELIHVSGGNGGTDYLTFQKK